MRRTLHTLSVTVLAGSALVGFAPLAAAEPTAEVSPATVEPGGTLTISVSCDPDGGSPPDTIDATSQAFEEGTVVLRKVTGNDDEVSGPAYRGTARIAAAENFEGDPDAEGDDSAWTVDGTCPAAPGGEGTEWSATFTVAHGGGSHDSGGGYTSHGASGSKDSDNSGDGYDSRGTGDAGDRQDGDDSSDGYDSGDASDGGTSHYGGESSGVGEVSDGADAGGGRDGLGGHKQPYEPTQEPPDEPCTEASHSAPDPRHGDTPCGGAVVKRGVRAGDGGAFSDSVPALIAGGVLIAGAFGAAAHRLRHRDSDPCR